MVPGVEVAVGSGVAVGGTGEAVAVCGREVGISVAVGAASGVFSAAGAGEAQAETSEAISARSRIDFFIEFSFTARPVFSFRPLKEFYQQSMQNSSRNYLPTGLIF